MRVSVAIISLAEQVFASSFTFFLFIFATRMMSGGDLEIYTVLFSLNQSFSFFLFGLVLIPVSTANGVGAEKQLGISLLLLVVLLVVFAALVPLVMRVFASFKGQVDVQLWALAVAFFAAQCTYETARWLCIRLRGARVAIIVTVLRLGLFFSTLFALDSGWLDATRFVLIQTGANVLAIVGFTLLLRRFTSTAKLALPDRAALKHLATFGNSAASFLANLAVVTLVDRSFGGGGLAAFQAVRSSTNPISLISQMLDNHYSADLARSGRRPERMRKGRWLIFIGGVVLIVIFTVIASHIMTFLFADKFDAYWMLVPILLIASIVHAMTRPVFVRWRIAGELGGLNVYSLAMVFGVLPLLVLTGLMGLTYTMVTVFALMPLIALGIDLYRHRTVVRDA